MDPSTIDAGIVAILVILSQMFGKMIPDTAEGPIGLIRRLFKIVGLYVENRKSE